MITKKSITDELNQLKKIGYVVKTFNSNHKMPQGAIGFVDHVLLLPKKGYIIFIEVKTKYDKIKKKKQIEYMAACKELEKHNPKFKYYVLTDDNWSDIIESLWRIK